MIIGGEHSIPGVDIEQQVPSLLTTGRVKNMPYGWFWVKSEGFGGEPPKTQDLYEKITFYALYPQMGHEGVGTLVNRTSVRREMKYLECLRSAVLLEDELAEDEAENALMRVGFEALIDEGEGLMRPVREFCAEKNAPLCLLAFWKANEDDNEARFASFHPTILISPQAALRSLQFVLWELSTREETSPRAEVLGENIEKDALGGS